MNSVATPTAATAVSAIAWNKDAAALARLVRCARIARSRGQTHNDKDKSAGEQDHENVKKGNVLQMLILGAGPRRMTEIFDASLADFGAAAKSLAPGRAAHICAGQHPQMEWAT